LYYCTYSRQEAIFFLYCTEIFIIQDEGLRIAWQYKKYFGDDSRAEHKGGSFTPSLNLVCSVVGDFLWNHAFRSSFLDYDMEYYLKRRDILIISKLIIFALSLLSTHSKESFVAT